MHSSWRAKDNSGARVHNRGLFELLYQAVRWSELTLALYSPQSSTASHEFLTLALRAVLDLRPYQQ